MRNMSDYLGAGDLRDSLAETAKRISLDKIEASPFQPRIHFTLVEKMAEDLLKHGQDYPIIVREHPDKKSFYQVADGETRLLAFRHNLTNHPDHPNTTNTILAVVRKLDDDQMMMLALRTALQRKSLTKLEEGLQIRRVMKAKDVTIEEMANELGVKTSYIIERIRLTDLPEDVLSVLQQKPCPIDDGHAIAVGALKVLENRTLLINDTIEQKLTVQEVRLKAKLLEPKESKKPINAAREIHGIVKALPPDRQEEILKLIQSMDFVTSQSGGKKN